MVIGEHAAAILFQNAMALKKYLLEPLLVSSDVLS